MNLFLRVEYFNPRSPCGERRKHNQHHQQNHQFQSTLPVWGATQALRNLCITLCISIHAPRVGSDLSVWSGRIGNIHFNPRSPCGERRNILTAATGVILFQSTLPVWGATLLAFQAALLRCISIHAPRVGSDNMGGICGDSVTAFQSTLPVWGATRTSYNTGLTAIKFQSTLPVWGATAVTD